MKRQINNDIDKYKDDVWKGLSLREVGFGGAAVVAGSVTTLLLFYVLGVPIIASTYIAIPVVVLVGLPGFFNKNGMTIFKYIKQVLKVIFARPYVYMADEHPSAIKFIKGKDENNERCNRIKKNKKAD